MSAVKKKGKSALPGAKRSSDLFKFSPHELVIMGLDNTQREHHLYDPGCHRPVSERLKRRIAKARGNKTPVGVTREADQVIVVFGRDRVKAMRELWNEAVEVDETPLMVECKVLRGLPSELFEAMHDENEARRKEDDPITRARKMNTAKDVLGEEGAMELFDCSLATINGAIKLLDLIPEVQKAVAAGTFGEIKARTLWGKSRQEQLDAVNGKVEVVTRHKMRPYKKVTSALRNLESWHAGAVLKENALGIALLKWFAGYITDEELAKQFPHAAPDMKQKAKA